MYDIKVTKGDKYADNYIFKSKNEYGQIIVSEVYRTTSNYLNFAFYVSTKRRHGYQEGIITGKDGTRSLVWAFNCLKYFIHNYSSRFSGEMLVVYPANKRLRKIYEYYLIPVGFKIMYDRYRSLYLIL